MVSIKAVRASNAALKESRHSLVAVFVGATAGIGMGTLKQFAKYAYAPKVYVVGRSKARAQSLIDEVTASNPLGTFVFLETEISLMKNVDQVCEEIMTRESKVDILFMSPGYLSFDGRKESSEGIDIPHALRYYTRLRFTNNLLPLLSTASSPRVVAILAGGKETEINFDDLECRNNFNGFKAAGNGATQTTLAFEELAKTNPSITFIHKFPGLVATGVLDNLFRNVSGVYAIPATIARYLLVPVIQLFATDVNVAGERGVFIATSARYPPAQPKAEVSGVALPKGVEVAKSSDVTEGEANGVYTLDASDESTPNAAVMSRYRRDGKGALVWEDTQSVWDRALGRSA